MRSNRRKNDFLSEGGAAWDLTENTVEMHDVIGNLKRAVEGSRERGIPVLFGPMVYTEEDYANEALHRRTGINRMTANLCCEGAADGAGPQRADSAARPIVAYQSGKGDRASLSPPSSAALPLTLRMT
ncbi:hypothetical protein [Nitratireductor sp. GCM10026969]|uniref:hypothetical protein n=1 Tax=Nitratireductor sp. GCM10026969 TaxID=3252645 RepID=UPI00360B03BA